jgi:hypothetical protein
VRALHGQVQHPAGRLVDAVIGQHRRVPRAEVLPGEAEALIERHDRALARIQRHSQLGSCLVHDAHRLPGVVAAGRQSRQIV